MIKYTCIIILFLITMLPINTFSKENWLFVQESDYCFIQSSPVKSEMPEGKSRGEHGMLVYTMNQSPDLIVQITAGFNYKSDDSIKVNIDKTEYSFYADGDTAWAKSDKKVIYAMKKGLELISTGISNKGTKVIDTYTLQGFTSALNKLEKDC